MPGDGGAGGQAEGGQRHRDAVHQYQIEQIGADDVAQGQRPVPLDQGGDGRDQLGQRGAQGDHRQGNDRFGHAQTGGDHDAVVHHQVGAHRDEGGGQRQPHQLHRQAAGRGRLGRGFAGCGGCGRAPGRGHLRRHIGRKEGQQDDAHPPAESAGGVGHRRVKDRRDEEEAHRQPQGGGVRLARPDCDGDGGYQRRIADDRANGVAVGDLAVAAQGRRRRNHHLG